LKDSLLQESFPAISANEAMKFSASARLLQFGTNPPVVVLEYEGKTYYHVTQDPAQPDAQKDTPVKARKQRQVTINEARNLLKKHEKLCTESPKEVLDALHNATDKLSLSVRKVRVSGKGNTACNYRRKRSQVKGLYIALTDHVIQDMSSDEEPHGFIYSDLVDTPYVLFVKEKHPCELKRLIRNAIMNEFWTRTMRRPTHFPGCKPLMLSQPTMLISVNHITTDDNTKNKFATFSSEVPAPHSGQIQQQFQQLQAQMRQLEQQLHGHESTTCTGGRPIHRSPEHLSRTSERYTPAGASPCTPHVVILVTKLNHQDRVGRGITIRATSHNIIGELWLHLGVLHHSYTMIQDDLSYRIDLMHKPIENGRGCHQTESDATPGAAIKNKQRLQPLHV
jgi:hypothetical protein